MAAHIHLLYMDIVLAYRMKLAWFPGGWIIHLLFEPAPGISFGYATETDQLVSVYWSSSASERE